MTLQPCQAPNGPLFYYFEVLRALAWMKLRVLFLSTGATGPASSMIYILLRDETTLEISNGFDVIHKPNCIVCIDPCGASVASFFAEDVMAYSFNPWVAQEFLTMPGLARRRPRRAGQASAKVRVAAKAQRY
jgi:hypothetical protein